MLWDESARVPVLADHSSIVIKSLRMRSTDLNERVQVNHSFIVDMPEVSVSPRTGGSVRIPNFTPNFVLDLWVFCKLEEGKG